MCSHSVGPIFTIPGVHDFLIVFPLSAVDVTGTGLNLGDGT